MRRLRGSILGLLVVTAVGCKDQLVVENVNNPDIERALNRPTDVEAFVAGQFRIIHNAWWSTGGIQPQLAVAGLESYSANANFGMGVRSPVPRSLIDNSLGNPADYYATWASLSQAARAASLVIERMNASSFTFFPTSDAQKHRSRAFAYFVKGVALGYMAMMFDSAPIIDPGDDIETPKAFVDYNTLAAAAIADLAKADSIASATFTGSNGFPIATTGPSWVQTNMALTGGATGNFARLVRAYRARIRAGVARTPAERAAVDWNAILADAATTASLPAGTDFQITYIASSGWAYNPMQASTYQSWHQMWQIMVGMADSSNNFQNWLATPEASKAPFLVLTSDTRFPSGATRPAQQASSGCGTSACLPPAGQYFRNRPDGQDVVVGGLYHSYYDFHRFQAYFNANQTGNVVTFARAELDMLMAEAYIRLNQLGNAVTAINASRTAHGLPAITVTPAAVTDPIVTGTSACVPRVPSGATVAANMTPTTAVCGNIMEAMKYEKRMETAFTSPGGWYFDGRGWGDLPVNTPLHFPVPYTELLARRMPIYSVPTAVSAATQYSAAERLSNSTSNYGLGH